MIYLKEFKIWDKIFGESNKSKNEKLALDIVNYHIDNDLYINNENKEYYKITNKNPEFDVRDAIYRMDGTITLYRIDKKTIDIKKTSHNILGLLHSQKNERKDKAFLYRNLYYIFDFNDDDRPETSESLTEYIWEIMNKYNDDYSFYTYPKTVNKFRLLDMLESEYEFNPDFISFKSRVTRINAVVSHYNVR